MKLHTLLVLSMSLALVPVAVCAQTAPPNGPPPSQNMQQARDNARTAAMNDLTPDHRAAVQGIVGKFDAGSVSMPDAASQIDALLTPDESTAVLTEAQKYRDARRPPGGGPPGGDHQGFHGMHKPDAGRFLVMVSASPDALQRAFSTPP